jgi:hypothetical protein
MTGADTPSVDDAIDRIALLLATHSQGQPPTEKEIAEYVGNGLILLRHALNSLVRMADSAEAISLNTQRI